MRTGLAADHAMTLVWSALGMACMLHCAPALAIVIAPATPDPWFSVSIEIDTKNLPAGVEFKTLNGPAGGFAGNFANTSATPLYLVRAPGTPPDWMRDLPPNVVPAWMAVSRGWFRMREPGEWTREGDGIPIERFLRLPAGESPAVNFEMDAYLGNQKITVGGRYSREWIRPSPGRPFQVDRFELKSPLPESLRLIEAIKPIIINYGSVPLYVPLGIRRSGDAEVVSDARAAGNASTPVGWLTEVPSGFLALRKVVAGKSYSAVLPDPLTNPRLAQIAPDGWVQTSDALAMVAMLTERTLGRYVAGFKFEQIYRDNRPGDAKVPAASPLEITAFYGAKGISINGRIVYALNPKYDPLAGQADPACVSCTGAMCDECARINARRGQAKK